MKDPVKPDDSDSDGGNNDSDGDGGDDKVHRAPQVSDATDRKIPVSTPSKRHYQNSVSNAAEFSARRFDSESEKSVPDEVVQEEYKMEEAKETEQERLVRLAEESADERGATV